MRKDARKRTVLRSIRLMQDLDELLEKDAKDRSISVNGLISAIMTKYVEWDRYSERFGYVSLTHDSFKYILEAADEEKLIKGAKEYGSKVPKEFMLFRFKNTSLDSFLKTLSLHCKYAGIAQYDLQSQGRDYILTIHHKFGQKWSSFFKTTLEQAIKHAVGFPAEFDVTTNSIAIKITAPY